MTKDEKETIERVLEALEATQEGFRAQSSGIASIEERLRAVEHVVRGNGSHGLVTKVALLEQGKKSGHSKISMLVTVFGYVLALVGTVIAAILSGK